MQPLWKTIWRFFRKTKIELSYKPAIALLDIYPDQTFTIAKTRKQPKCSLTRDEDVAHMHNEILLSQKKNEIMPFATT